MNFILLFFYVTKNPTPQQLALLSALNTAITLLIVMVVVKLLVPESMSWWVVAGFPALNLLTSFFSMYEALRRFIYRKIKLIYKSIHHLKAPKDSAPLHVDMRNHIIDQVEHEVVEWAKDWTQEIKYLKKMEEFRKEFIGNVSHELKTPIFNMQGYLYTLIDEDIEDPVLRQKYLERAIDNVERMAAIVDDLNEIARLEAGQIKLKNERFDICELAQEVMEDAEMLAQQNHIIVEFKDAGEAKEFYVRADRERIRQVLTNLVTNSIKYGKDGGKTLVAFYDFDHYIMVEVSDNGRGIAEEHLPRLFERFYRVDKGRSREDGGSGLGLAIVKHIVEAHNQAVHVRSRLGVGSTFGFTLEKAK